MNLGEDPEWEFEEALNSRMEKSRNEGLSSDGESKMTDLLKKLRYIFRIRLGKDEPTIVEPMQLKLIEDEKPIIMKSQRYSPQQRAFMESNTK